MQGARQPPVLRESILATPNRVQPANDGEGATQLAHVGVRSEVAGTRNVPFPGDQYSRKGLGEGYGNGRIALVVLEANVEAGPVLLDEVVLEDERAGLTRHHDGLHVGDEPL
jgi:hypothetical protein